MTKTITTYQAVLLEFDTVCAETGWKPPIYDEMVRLAKALDETGDAITEETIAAAVIGYNVAKCPR